jgi:hypothetical protein
MSTVNLSHRSFKRLTPKLGVKSSELAQSVISETKRLGKTPVTVAEVYVQLRYLSYVPIKEASRLDRKVLILFALGVELGADYSRMRSAWRSED